MNIMQIKISGPLFGKRIFERRKILIRIRIFLCMVILILSIASFKVAGQGVGISEVTIVPEPSAILELRSTVRGFLAPRMTTDQRLLLGDTSPAAGLLVYDTDTKSFWYWDSGWKAFASGVWGASNQLLGMNAAGDANEYKTLAGTTNQINVAHSAGQITLSAAQDIHTEASPVFQGLTVSELEPNADVYTDNQRRLTTVRPSSGTIGYWNRTGSVLSPANEGDNISTSGNIYTTESGSIASAGLLTGNSGATILGGTINLNNDSNFPVNISTGTSSGNISLGNSANKIILPAFNTSGIVHNNALGELSTGLIVNDDITNGTINLISKVTGVLPVIYGGTNSDIILQNHRMMVSRNGRIVEAGHLGDGMIIVGKDNDEPQLVTMSGDITVSNSGVTTIGNNRVVNAMLSNNSVTSDKILDGTIKTADLEDNSVIYEKLQNLSTTGRLLGSSDTSTAVQEITLGTGLSLNGNELTASGTGGTVTSVGLSLPDFFTVSNSPVTNSGSLTGTLVNQTKNTVFAAPDGSNGIPVFRTLEAGDIPEMPWSKITTGKPTTLSGYGIIDAMSNSHAANIITSSNITNWNTAFGWGNHAEEGYLKTYTESDSVVKSINGIVKSNGVTISAAAAGTDYVVPNTAIATGTNTKITYDTKGLVTGSSAAVLASADYAGQGTVNTVLHGGGAGNPSWSQINNSDIANDAGIADSKLATISTNGKVANSATTATSTNSQSTIVLRDTNGDFSAGTITANLTGTATNAINSTNAINANTATNLTGGSGGSIPYQTAAGTTAMLANGTIGQILVSNGGTAAPSWATFNDWKINGNTGTNPATNFIGTIDNNDVVFRANNTERARIESVTGHIKIGDASNGTVKATKELVLREDNDEYGSFVLRLRNRENENGAIFENTNASKTLIDFMFKTESNQRNIRFESRLSYARTGNPSFHIGGADPDNPSLSIGDNYSAFNRPLKIGNYDTPAALLHLSAGTASANTAPLKLTPGTNLSSPEDGAVEYDGEDYYVTIGTERFTLAKTIKANKSLNFGLTPAKTSQDCIIYVPGASNGDPVVLGVPFTAIPGIGCNYTAWVSATDFVTIRFSNFSEVPLDPGTGNFNIRILK